MPRCALRGALAAATLVVAGLAAGLPLAGAVAPTETTRLGGASRYETAALVAADTFPDGADRVILATGEGFADALAAAGLAGANAAPILLTRTDALPAPTTGALDDLGTSEVVLIGGTAAISQAVEDELVAADLTVTRVQGATRYETAAAVAAQIAATGTGIGATGDGVTVLLASGLTFPDAVSASASAYVGPFPVLLTQPGELPEATANAIADNEVAHVIIVGGTAAISDDVRSTLEDDLGVTTLRLAGTDRYRTNTTVADFALGNLGASAASPYLSTGTAFPDALVGGPAAGATGNLLLLTDPEALPATTAELLTDNAGVADAVVAVGGQGAVSDDVLAEAAGAAVLDDYQVLSIDPTGTDELPPSSSPFTSEGARTYTASDLDAGTTYRIALLDPDVVSAMGGITRISAFRVSDDASTAIEMVDGSPVMAGPAGSGFETVTATATAGEDGTFTFTVDAAAQDEVIPVVWRDDDGDEELTLVGDLADEPYGLGGLTSWAS